MARSRLRQLLGELSRCRPEDIRLAADARGKSRLQGAGSEPLRFSVAHAAELMVCAFARDHDVGIDVTAGRTRHLLMSARRLA